MKNKVITIIIVITTVLLAGIAIFTALRLYQLRKQAVAPTAPESKPKAAYPPDKPHKVVTCNKGRENEFDVKLSALDESPVCTVNSEQCQGKDEVKEYSTRYRIVIDPKDSGITSFPITYAKDSFWCLEPCGDGCIENHNKIIKNATLNAQNNFTTVYTVSRKSDPGVACGTYQTDTALENVENCDLFPQPDPRHYWTLSGVGALCRTNIECPIEKVDCLDVKAYKHPSQDKWVLLSSNDLKELKAGEKISFTVTGKGPNISKFTKAKFKVNSESVVESTTKKPRGATDPNDEVEFYIDYTIPSQTIDFRVQASIYHEDYGWIGTI